MVVCGIQSNSYVNQVDIVLFLHKYIACTFPEATESWSLLILSQPVAQVLGIKHLCYLLMQLRELDHWVSMTVKYTYAFCFRPNVLFTFVSGFVMIINFLF